MGTKNKPGAFDCYASAEPDEPMFILIGRDPAAAGLVEEWARRRASAIGWGQKPETDSPMVVEALNCAAHMKAFAAAWPDRKKDREMKAKMEDLKMEIASSDRPES